MDTSLMSFSRAKAAILRVSNWNQIVHYKYGSSAPTPQQRRVAFVL